MANPVQSWFKDDFFDTLPGSINVETRRDVECAYMTLADSSAYPRFPAIPDSNLGIMPSVLNRRLAINLNKTSFSSDPKNSNLKKVVARFLALDGEHEVPVHVLYRCARGFLMIPEGVWTIGEQRAAESQKNWMSGQTQFAVAETFRPQEFGLTTGWKPVSPKNLKPFEEQSFIQRQERALQVYLTFCGDRANTQTGEPFYGSEFEKFMEAALAYYCSDDSELCQPKVCIHVFPEAKSKSAQEPDQLPAGTALCLGVGHTDFGNSSLRLKADLPHGTLSVRGILDLDGRDECLKVCHLRVEIKTPEASSDLQLTSFVDESDQEWPEGVRYQPNKTVVLDLRRPDTDALRRTFDNWIPALEVINTTRPFEMEFSVYAPLAGMDLLADAETAPNNQVRSAKELLIRYLRGFISLDQKEWEPTRKVPVIGNGIFHVDASTVRDGKR